MARYSEIEVQAINDRRVVNESVAAAFGQMEMMAALQNGSGQGDAGLNGVVRQDGSFEAFFRAGDVCGGPPVMPES